MIRKYRSIEVAVQVNNNQVLDDDPAARSVVLPITSVVVRSVNMSSSRASEGSEISGKWLSLSVIGLVSSAELLAGVIWHKGTILVSP